MSNEENKHKDAGQGEQENSKPEIRYMPVDIRPIEDEEDEIDLLELVKTVWMGRKVIAAITGLFIVAGIAIALISSEQFTAQVKLLPESTAGVSSLGSLGGLASQFGVNLPGNDTSEGITPALYPSIIQSNLFLIDLLQYKVSVPQADQLVTLETYFKEYRESSLINTIVKYTIQLPFTLKKVLMGTVNGSQENTNTLLSDEKEKRLIRQSDEQWEIIRNFREQISAGVDNETGVVTVTATMDDPRLSADIADEAVNRLSKFIIKQRTEKARQELEFVEARFEEARQQFKAVQRELAEFNDANRGQLTALARTEEQLLQSQYNLTFNIYNSLAERVEQAQIALQEDTPVINIIEPAAVPDRRSSPQRTLLVIVFTLLGGIAGVGYVLSKPLLTTIKNELQKEN